MRMRQISERDGDELSAGAGHQRSDDCAHTSRIARLSQLLLLAIGVYFCSSLALWAQTSDSPTGDAANSWTATTDSQSGTLNPTRTIETHTRSGNRPLDKQSLQRRGADGHFEPYQEVEKETVQLDAPLCEPPPAPSVEMPMARKPWCR